MPKFYILEEMTQDDLNKLALERNTLAHNWNELKKYFKRQTIELEKVKEDISIDHYVDRKMFLKEVLMKMQELEEGGNDE